MKHSFKALAKRIVPAALAVALAVTMTGCGKNEAPEKKIGTGKMPESLSVYAELGSLAAKAGCEDRGDILAYQIIEEQTGCKIDWICPSAAVDLEQFNLMIASRKYPDIIEFGWSIFDTHEYVDDGVIVPISDYLDYMPNFKKFIEENPEIAKQFVNDDGSIHYVPCVRRDPELTVYVGPTIRKDWLDKLSLEMPTNVDELYEVLKAFKTQDPNGNGEADEIPFSGMGGDAWAYGIGNIVWAFDTNYTFYVEDGKVTHGMLEKDKMKPALEYLAKLYKEGLIDTDYLINDEDKYHGKVLNDRTGFMFGIQPSRYYTTLNDGTKELVGVPYFDGLCFNQVYKNYLGGGHCAITTACEDPSGAAIWLDHFFSEEGITATNFGIEGETYNVVDGKKVLSEDYLFNNPNGLESKEVCASSFIGATTDFASVQLWEYYSQTLQPWGKAAIEVWTNSATKLDGALPPIKFTAEENDKILDDLTTINTYVSEQFNNIIIGRTSVDELDNIAAELDKMGMQEVLKVHNDAYQRYLNK